MGNRIGNDYFEYSLDPSRKPNQGASPETISSFIRAKYVFFCFRRIIFYSMVFTSE